MTKCCLCWSPLPWILLTGLVLSASGRPTLEDNSLKLDVNEIVNTCDETNSKNWFIYCSGRLLESAMDYHLYNDSKTFVDKPMKQPAVAVKQAFDSRFPVGQVIDKDELQVFVDEHFDPEGTELEECQLGDWTQTPPLLAGIKDKALKSWALGINVIWKDLCRKMKRDVAERPDQYSLIYVPNQFVVPGGRFREFYYWDAYWIIKGLIASGMHQTTKDMLGNFVYMVENHGFIPNGGRVYYLRRSQPPMLIHMAYEYFEATNDLDYISMILPTLEKELMFWIKNRKVNITLVGEQVEVFQYRSASNVPRPESYREDVHLAQNFTDTEKRRIYRNLASAAESGWDFSSRWFEDGKNLNTIDTVNVVPVDLNAFICGNLNLISFLYGRVGNGEKATEYHNKFVEFRRVFQKAFYKQDIGAWFDYNLRTGKHNTDFYASMATPLFTGCYHSLDSSQIDNVYNVMVEMGAFGFLGGVPTSMHDTHQQWDFPNGWSPLEHMIVEGLRRSPSPKMQERAFRIAEKWILTNRYVYLNTQEHMWEKYQINGLPDSGTGGEYDVQSGFGWTNGVVLDFLVTYSDRMSLNVDTNNTQPIENNEVVPTTQQQQQLGMFAWLVKLVSKPIVPFILIFFVLVLIWFGLLLCRPGQSQEHSDDTINKTETEF